MDVQRLKDDNKVLVENEKRFVEKFESSGVETHDLKVKILNQQNIIDSYITEMNLLKKENSDAQSEILDLKRKLSNVSTSSLVLDEIIHSQRLDTKSKTGIGYHSVPPPTSYTQMPDLEEKSEFVPSGKKVDIKSPNEKNSSNSIHLKGDGSDCETVDCEKVIKPEVSPISKISKPCELDLQKRNLKIDEKKDLKQKQSNTCNTIKQDIKILKKKNPITTSQAKSQSSVKSSCQKTCSQKCETSSKSSKTNDHVSQQSDSSSCENTKSSHTSLSHTRKKYETRKCHYCGIRGHLLKDCFRLAKKHLKEQNKANSSSNVHEKNVSHTFNKKSNKSSKPQSNKKSNSSNDTSIKDQIDLKQNLKQIDVIMFDEITGRPKPSKAWVSIVN